MTSNPLEAPEIRGEIGRLFVFGVTVFVLITTIILLGSTSPRTGFYGVSLFLLLLGIYMMPTIIALNRHHRNTSMIAVLDVFLGWTFVGWVIALVWSLTEANSTGRASQRIILWGGYAVVGAVLVTFLIAVLGYYLFSERAFLFRW
jgi:hypothetical protein